MIHVEKRESLTKEIETELKINRKNDCCVHVAETEHRKNKTLFSVGIIQEATSTCCTFSTISTVMARIH